jgi:hypothetical protein
MHKVVARAMRRSRLRVAIDHFPVTSAGCAAQLVRAETVALKGPTLPEVSTARTRK